MVTKTELCRVVTALAKATAVDFELGHSNGGYRLVRTDGYADVSPRLPAGQLRTWLAGYWMGIDHGFDCCRETDCRGTNK
jgi:hypothetical protein